MMPDPNTLPNGMTVDDLLQTLSSFYNPTAFQLPPDSSMLSAPAALPNLLYDKMTPEEQLRYMGESELSFPGRTPQILPSFSPGFPTTPTAPAAPSIGVPGIGDVDLEGLMPSTGLTAPTVPMPGDRGFMGPVLPPEPTSPIASTPPEPTSPIASTPPEPPSPIQKDKGRPANAKNQNDVRRAIEADKKHRLSLEDALKRGELDKERLSAFASIAEGLGNFYPSTLADYRIRGKAPEHSFVAKNTRQKIAEIDDRAAGMKMTEALRASGINLPDGLTASQLQGVVGPLTNLEAYRRRADAATAKAVYDAQMDAQTDKTKLALADEKTLLSESRDFKSKNKELLDAAVDAQRILALAKSSETAAARGQVIALIRAFGDKRISVEDVKNMSGRFGILPTAQDIFFRWFEGKLSPGMGTNIRETARILAKFSKKMVYEKALARAESLSKITKGRISTEQMLDALGVEPYVETVRVANMGADGNLQFKDLTLKELKLARERAKQHGMKVTRDPGGVYVISKKDEKPISIMPVVKSGEDATAPMQVRPSGWLTPARNLNAAGVK